MAKQPQWDYSNYRQDYLAGEAFRKDRSTPEHITCGTSWRNQTTTHTRSKPISEKKVEGVLYAEKISK